MVRKTWSCLGRAMFSLLMDALSVFCHISGPKFLEKCLVNNVKFMESWLCTSLLISLESAYLTMSSS
jgi:hypothetical protein